MKRTIALFVLLTCTVMGVLAQGRMSAATRLALQHTQLNGHHTRAFSDQQLRAFILIDSEQTIDRLREKGVHIQFDGDSLDSHFGHWPRVWNGWCQTNIGSSDDTTMQ